MDKSEKKRELRDWRDAQRAAARAALPLPDDALESLFDDLAAHLSREPCDHTRRLTTAWITRSGHDPAPVLAWLDQTGGYCDCEVVANSESEWRIATRRA